MIRKPLTILFIFISTLSFSQDEMLVLKGETLGHWFYKTSKSTYQNIFCFKKGNYDTNGVRIFTIDSIIAGTIDSENIKLLPLEGYKYLPFNVKFVANFTKINNTEIYYISNVKSIYPSKKYPIKKKSVKNKNRYKSDKKEYLKHRKKFLSYIANQEKYKRDHLYLSEVIKKGAPQKIKITLDSLASGKSNLKYIKDIIPFINSRDSITINIIETWDGTDLKTGRGIGGIINHPERILFSEYIHNYLENRIPYKIPSLNENINWLKWYNELINQKCTSHTEKN